MNEEPTPAPGTPEAPRGGLSAGWVVALVIIMTLVLGATFFVIAHSQPLELISR